MDYFNIVLFTRWKKYGMLWLRDKQKTIDKFVEDNPSLAAFDVKLISYTEIAQELRIECDFKDIGAIRIHKRPLLAQISEHALEWKTAFGERLTVITLVKMNEFKEVLTNFKEKMNLVVKDLDTFKIVMTTITQILRMAVQAELQYVEFQEAFYTIKTHDLPVRLFLITKT